ncbi:hypothetical protein [Ekhidna sp.]|uniref:hypothetical protein n=1 Tax=Ekhidna sp. TaxID=2608089 RepID=UPI003B5CD7AB
MERIIKKLNQVELEIDKHIAKRDQIFDSRSSSWQNSDKGMEFMDDTEVLREALFSIEQAKSSLEQL